MLKHVYINSYFVVRDKFAINMSAPRVKCALEHCLNSLCIHSISYKEPFASRVRSTYFLKRSLEKLSTFQEVILYKRRVELGSQAFFKLRPFSKLFREPKHIAKRVLTSYHFGMSLTGRRSSSGRTYN